MRSLARYAIGLAMIVVGLLLGLDILYFAHGSLEEFPTDEQVDKVRRVTAVGAAILIVTEVGLWSLLRSLPPIHSPTDPCSPPTRVER